MAGEVPAYTMRAVLQAMQEVGGRQYASLVTQAGLSRFLQALPADDPAIVASTAELSQLYGIVYNMLGEGATRLLLRNYGTVVAQMGLQMEWGHELAARAAEVPIEQRLAWLVPYLANFLGIAWAPHTASEDAKAWYLATADCPICVEIRGAKAPLCANDEAIYGAIARKVMGRRVHVAEVECLAMGQAHCKLAFYK
ncbi:MAG TPA: V4R domain-containing protein [Chloroflexia bacterium]|nr:V4R domain-containing protein [Chloroflexia bacterium]